MHRCIGGIVGKFKDLEEAQRVNVALPQAAAEAFAIHVAPTTAEVLAMPKKKRGHAFRFIYLSMAGAEQDQFASLWSQGQSRKAKGAAEKGLFEYAQTRDPATFEVYALRLGPVLPGGQTVYNIVQMGIKTCISDFLAARKCINLALDGRGDEGGPILENADCLGDDWGDMNSLQI